MVPGERGKSHDAIASKELERDELQSWLSSSESGHSSDEFADLARLVELIPLVLVLMSHVPSEEKDKTFDNLLLEFGQTLATTLRSLQSRLNRRAFRSGNDEVIDLAWRSLGLCIDRAVAIAAQIPFPPDHPRNPPFRSSRTRKIFSYLDDYPNEQARATPSGSTAKRSEGSAQESPLKDAAPAEPEKIKPDELVKTIRSLRPLIFLIIEHLNLVRSWCASSPRLNRLGLSEIQIGILRALYPDQLLTAAAISEKLGIPTNEKGTVTFLGQLKPEATLRRLGLLGTQRGVEGGYFLSDKGRQVFEEYAGLDQTGPKKNRVDDTWVLGGRLPEQESERKLAELFGPPKIDEALASTRSVIDRREKTPG